MKMDFGKTAFLRLFILAVIWCTASTYTFGQSKRDTIPAVTACTSDWVGHVDSIKMKSILTLHVDNLRNLLEHSKSPSEKPVLFLNGMALGGLYPIAIDPADDQMSFQLVHTDNAKSVWNLLHQLGKPARRVDISVGLEGSYPVKSKVTKTLILYSSNALLWSVALIVLFILVFIALVKYTDILRDSGPEPPTGMRRTFSLGQCQMAWWFIMVLAVTAIVGVVTGELPTFPSSVLTLLGIAGGTALGSAAIDAGKPDTSPSSRYAMLASEAEALEDRAKNESGSAAITAQLNQKRSEMKRLELKVFSSGFLNDILSDNAGINFHRLQVFIWTIFFGIVFLLSAIETMVIKDFDSTWLTLMGISSGTYIGFKIPAQRT